MKNLKQIFTIIIFFSILLIIGCSEDFLNRPPKDSIVDAGFYSTDNEVLSATALLYNRVWFQYNDKASFAIGDFRAGTMLSGYNDRTWVEFNATADDAFNSSAWASFYVVIAQSNMAIENIKKYAGPKVSESIKNHAIAEARFMRALAYRYLVMNWGEVPIIENNLTLLTDTTIQKNTIESVWKFVTYEMRAAADNLMEKAPAEGRISKWSAEGMLARFYLTRAGVESSGGTRKQEFLDSAKYYSERVILNSGKNLLDNYASLFLYPYDNNEESLFELQWVTTTQSEYGSANSTPTMFTYNAEIAPEGGWGGDKAATFWMLQQYEGFQEIGTGELDTIKGRTIDQRLKATFMLPGAHYSEITQDVDGGKTQELIFQFNDDGSNYANIKKYVIGGSRDIGTTFQARYPNNTYMMRLSEMYLIYAEAELGNQASTTDSKAMAYFNAVHTRAGLAAVTDPITFDMIFRERIVEFAVEAMAWYDLVSLHYYNPEKAYSIINSQDRGLYYIIPDQFPNSNEWTIVAAENASRPRKVTAYSGNFTIPLPSAEVSQAPNLKKPAVNYYVSK